MQGFFKSLHRTYSSWQHSESFVRELSMLSLEGRIEEAMHLLRQIPYPNPFKFTSQTYLPLVRSCIKFKAFGKGKEIHKHMVESGVEPNLLLQNNIVMLYSKSGDSELARQVFEEMTERNLFSWTAMIGAYSNSGDSAQAFEFYQRMGLEGIRADNFIYSLVLKSCAGMKDMRSGRRVHADIVRSGFGWDLVIANSLIDMYAKCGSLRDAESLFYESDARDVFSWTTMLVGCVQSGYGLKALELFRQMLCSEVRPRSATFSGVLPVFSDFGCLRKAKQMHGLAIIINGSNYDNYFGNALIDMYQNCGGLGYARLIFDRVKGRDAVCWTTMIKGCVQAGFPDEAMNLFKWMLRDGIRPNKTTLEFMIPLYLQSGQGIIGLFHQLEQMGLHSTIVSATLLDSMCEHVENIKEVHDLHWYLNKNGCILENSVGAAVIRMYSKFADIEAAQGLFDSISAKGLDCWNAIIGCYVDNRHTDKALELFDLMLKTGVEPNLLSWETLITGLVDAGDFDSALQIFTDMVWTNQKLDVRSPDIILLLIQSNTYPMTGKELHCMLLKNVHEMSKFVCTTLINMYGNCGDVPYAVNLFDSMKSKDLVSWNTIINIYAKNGFLDEASKAFDEMRKAGITGNIITWTSIISGYARSGQVDESLKKFRELERQGLRPNSITIASILPACAQSATLSHGKSLHAYIIRSGLDGEDPFVSNALIDMFVKCGCMDYAERLFMRLPRRDVVSWNTMIHGFAINGSAKDALALFDQMEVEGEIPNSITFIEVLNACSHTGLVNEGWKLFNDMESKYGITPRGKHYACMVDILGRGGHFEDVRDFIVQMPLQPTASLWGALLSASKTHKNIEMAEYAAKNLIELQPDNPGNYVVLSNIYATEGRWNDVDRVRKMMVSRGVQKSPGSSWIEIGNNVHAFAVETLANQEIQEINRTVLDLTAIMIEEGYVPDANTANFDYMAEGG